MKYLYLPILLIFLSHSISFSAQSASEEPCGFDLALERTKAFDPGFESTYAANEKRLQEFLAGEEQAGIQRLSDDEIIEIPIVFHILYHTDEENIPDSVIYSQLEVMNNDFRRMNADTVNTPLPFQAVAADTRIQFCMATRDPEGNPTTGITRTYTEKENFNFSTSNYEIKSEMHFDIKGGKDIWDRDQYLNVWVCNPNESSSTIAFAYLPGADVNVDGIVCNYRYFGSPSIVGGAYDYGRTMSHEAGHWLNLWHTFNGDGDGSACSDDFVNDTPPQEERTFGCPSFPALGCDTIIGDMYMNYMDYTDDSCANMFSAGQAERMRAALQLMRPGILSSMACQAFAEHDARILEISQPDPNYCFSTVVPVSCIIRNEGTEVLSSLAISYKANDGAYSTYNWTGELAHQETEEVLVGFASAQNGLNTIEVVSSAPNGEADAYPQTDTLRMLMTAGTGVEPPIVQTFDTPYTESGWHIIDGAEMVPWNQIRALDVCSDGEPGAVLGVKHDFHDYFEVLGSTDEFISPNIDLSATLNTQLSFDYSYRYVSLRADSLQVLISTECGSDYITEFSDGGSTLSTRTAQYPQSADDWQNVTIDLSEYDGQEIVVNFKTITDGGYFLFIDNINISGDIIEGVGEELSNDVIPQLSPNPVVDELYIYSAPENLVELVELYDINGRLLRKEAVNNAAINVSDLSEGLYLIKCISVTGKESVHKLLKQ